MSHLQNITFTNFRVFNNKTDFEIRPLTFLTGPNSSGKSSVLKSLLLLKSNQSSSLQVLNFSGPKHNLGTFDNTQNKYNSKNDVITFGLGASIARGIQLSSFIKKSVITKRNVYTVLKEDKSIDSTDIYIELSYKANGRSGQLSSIEIFFHNDKTSFLRLDIVDTNSIEKEHKLRFDYNRISKDKNLKKIFLDDIVRTHYKLEKIYEPWHNRCPIILRNIKNSKSNHFDEPILVFTNLYKQFILDKVVPSHHRDYNDYLIGNPLRSLLKDFSSIIDNTEYLEAVRANTKRLYTNDSQGTSFNELILDYRSREISVESVNFTNKWLKEFKIAEKLLFENIEGVATTIYLQKSEDVKDKIALADLGYGITQFLPIILKIALEEPIRKDIDERRIVKKLILLEEPETNLHPKLQSLIADFLIDAIKTFEVRFIVETHSEYIMRKTQILTAEEIINTNESVIYYFNDPEAKVDKQVIKIDINKNGSLSDEFGSGFFDEATNLKFKLLKMKLKK